MLIIGLVIGVAIGFGAAWMFLEGWREYRCLPEIERYEMARRKAEADMKAREPLMHLPPWGK